ncbi:DUF1651 domain-containing protein [Synechococcus sp. CS-205]|uniref:DUF1651 domain-containing protein n=1 Tax=Synechococcus sp. CS-205 TaxID=2847984 RepID=UPI002A459B05|nr:DUF1651 domain-containing protein [Synechococcus sp. CS-205]
MEKRITQHYGRSGRPVQKPRFMPAQRWELRPLVTKPARLSSLVPPPIAPRFHRGSASRCEAAVFIDLGEPIPGQSALPKPRVGLPRKQAIEQWQKLLDAGWFSIGVQFTGLMDWG